MKNLVFAACAFFLTFAFVTPAAADIKVKKTSRLNMPNMPPPMRNPQTGEMMDPSKLPDSMVLIKGARMLTEMRHESNTGMGKKKYITTQLRQCDLGRELRYTNKSKKYFVTNFSASPQNLTTASPAEKDSKESGGTVTYSITYTDTGERQQMHGYPARRVKSVMMVKPSPDACQKQAMKIETDAWYIDLPTFSCPTFSTAAQPGNDNERGCNDKIIYQLNGTPERGFAVKETMTMTSDGNPSVAIIHEVAEINQTELDAALFDVPPGYTEDKDSSSGSTAQNNSAPSDSSNNNASLPTATTNNPPPTMPANASDTALQPKKPGVVRIGIAKPKIQMPEDKDDHTAPLTMSSAVRDSLIDSLKAENVEAIRLATDTPEAEAKQKECDYIFYANVTQKRGGGGMFGKMVAMTAISMAGAMVPGVGAMIASTVASQVMAQQMGKAAKAKDEFTLDYKLTDLNAAVLSQAVTKAKAKTDGEDVLTTQIKQASTAVLGEIAKKK